MGFECCHPAVNFLYFAVVLTATVLFRRPAFLAISYVSAFSFYSADSRDRAFVLAFSAALTGVLMAHLLGQARMVFDPQLLMLPVTPTSALFWAAYAVLCLLPMAMEVFTQLRLNRQRDQI